jgi:hypothetical protein
MGRTISKFRDDDEDRRKNRSAKHSKNIPGKGMRVINNWSAEEDDDDFDNNYEGFIYDESDEYYANTSQTQRK